jgi:hypothetical protein
MKSTHSGTCQLCGRLHKLPGNRAAKHGYSVQWSQFIGTCPGSDELPYELSCDLIVARIPAVLENVARLERMAAGIRATTATVFVHEWVKEAYVNGKYVRGHHGGSVCFDY